MRQKLFDHVKKKYKAKPEYLWKRYPDYAIFRHIQDRLNTEEEGVNKL